MKQLTLDLQNYRKFKTLHLDFHPRFTLLMGVNGTGKTSVLHGIWRSWQSMISSANAGGSMPTLREVHQQVSIDVSSESWLTTLFPLRAVGDFFWNGFTLEKCGVVLSDSSNSGVSLNRLPWRELTTMVKAAFQADTSTPIPLLARFGAAKPQPAGETGGLKKPFSERKDVWALAQSDEVQSAVPVHPPAIPIGQAQAAG